MIDTQQHKPLNVLVIGDACLDKYHYGSCDRISSEAPVPVFKHSYTEEREGMCFNVANNLVALGVKVDTLRSVELIHKERFVDIKTKQHLLRSDFGENKGIDPLSITEIKGIEFECYDAVVISDYNKGFITSENGLLIAKCCMKLHVPLFVDSKKRDLSCFDGSVIKINEKEWNHVTRYPRNYELVVTLGAQGASWNNNTYKTRECEIFDVCGAGDTFLASLVFEHLRTSSIEKSIIFANSCSRIAVQKFGTYILTKEDIDGLRS